MNNTPDVGDVVLYRGKKWIVVGWTNTGGTTGCDLVSEEVVDVPWYGLVRVYLDAVSVDALDVCMCRNVDGHMVRSAMCQVHG